MDYGIQDGPHSVLIVGLDLGAMHLGFYVYTDHYTIMIDHIGILELPHIHDYPMISPFFPPHFTYRSPSPTSWLLLTSSSMVHALAHLRTIVVFWRAPEWETPLHGLRNERITGSTRNFEKKSMDEQKMLKGEGQTSTRMLNTLWISSHCKSCESIFIYEAQEGDWIVETRAILVQVHLFNITCYDRTGPGVRI